MCKSFTLCSTAWKNISNATPSVIAWHKSFNFVEKLLHWFVEYNPSLEGFIKEKLHNSAVWAAERMWCHGTAVQKDRILWCHWLPVWCEGVFHRDVIGQRAMASDVPWSSTCVFVCERQIEQVQTKVSQKSFKRILSACSLVVSTPTYSRRKVRVTRVWFPPQRSCYPIKL